MKKPIIGITMGDPAGVGPEITLKALAWPDLTSICHPVVFGDYELLLYCSRTLGLPGCFYKAEALPGGFPEHWDQGIPVVHGSDLDLASFRPGQIQEQCGRASVAFVREACRAALNGRINAVVTCPINKEAVRLSEPNFSGHTELLAGETGSGRVTMALISPKLTVTHVTTHVSMREACTRITRERVYQVIQLTDAMVKRLNLPGKIAVAGLNAHAGENGAFGDEEIKEVIPAIENALAQGLDISGPLPADTAFLRASRGEFSAVVAMYHDQGHIPIKLLDFDGAVNVTLGLPITRTSVDHGTAFDVAWRGIAKEANLIAAIKLACRLGVPR